MFCKFDIAATGRVEIGETTYQGGQDFEQLVNLSKPSNNLYNQASLNISLYFQKLVILPVFMVLVWILICVLVEKVMKETRVIIKVNLMYKV